LDKWHRQNRGEKLPDAVTHEPTLIGNCTRCD
jgi:hypothetical protein